MLDKLQNVRLGQKARAELLERENEYILSEYFSNLKTLIKSCDEYLSCNCPFQLLHFASNKFLSGIDEESEGEKENRKYPRTNLEDIAGRLSKRRNTLLPHSHLQAPKRPRQLRVL